MTNAFQPLSGLPGFGGGTAPLAGLPGFSAVSGAPQAVQQPGALPPHLAGETIAQHTAARGPASDVGVLETVGTQAARGLLDAVLGSGALTGAAAESVGALGGWKGLEDFGRDLGQASSGTAAMEAAAFVFGGGGQKGLSYAERTERAIAEQEKAWPMLSAVSKIGGSAAFGIMAGGVAGSLRGAAAIGAYEGAGAGASAAYEKNESLRDVLVSTLAGATLGAGAGAAAFVAPRAVGKYLDDRNVLKNLFGDVKTAADDVANAVKEAGGREIYDASKAILKERARILQEMAAAGDNPSVIREAYEKATRFAGERISKLAGEFDATKWATETPSALQKLVHRTPLLDQVATDLADDAARLRSVARPSLDFEPRITNAMLKGTDRVAAVSGLQSRVMQALETMPDPTGTIAGSTALRGALGATADALQRANAPEAFSAAHRAVRALSELSQGSDDVTASFARRQAQAIADELSGPNWGEAGKLYGALTRADSITGDLSQSALRKGLQHADSSKAIPGIFAEEAQRVVDAFAASKKLGGGYMSDDARNVVAAALRRSQKAHDVATFDGAPAKRVLDVLSGAARNIGESYSADLLGMGVGMAIGGIPGALVARALAPMLGQVAAAAFGKGIKRAGEKAGRQFGKKVVEGLVAEKVPFKLGERSWSESVKAAGDIALDATMEVYNQRLDKLSQLVASASPEAATQRERAVASLPPELQGMAGADMQSKLAQLLQDIPKPQPNVRGKAYETLSRADLRKATAMYEATVQPLSVFSDFAAGNIDYDKVAYAWRQYPGLKLAAQAGLGDIIEQQLSEDERSSISDTMLSQLDSLFGFEGELQPTLNRQFSSRIDQLAQAQQQENPPPRPGGSMKLPGAQPTLTQRISGQRG